MNLFRTLLFIALAALFGAAPSFASFNQGDITNMNNAEPPLKNARDHGWKTSFAKCVFNPSATTGERSIGAHACDLVLPKKAIVTGAWYKVLTTFADGASDSATIAISLLTANDIFTATAISSGTTWDAAGPIEGVPKIETTSTWLDTTTTPAAVTFTVGSVALTAGKMVVWVQYLYYGDA